MHLFFFSSRRRHTRCALVTGVQTCALPILPQWTCHLRGQARGRPRAYSAVHWTAGDRGIRTSGDYRTKLRPASARSERPDRFAWPLPPPGIFLTVLVRLRPIRLAPCAVAERLPLPASVPGCSQIGRAHV